jgi:sarcosine reductase complex component B subunit beta
MSTIKVVHYLNNFFAGIGGEEKADIPPMEKKGKVGPGLALAQALGEGSEIVATVICGDNYFGENLKEAESAILEMIRRHQPDLVMTGPAFNAGRYGVACGAVAKAVEEQLGIPAVTGMFEENPGLDLYRKDLFIIKTGHSAAGMTKAVKAMAALGLKLTKGEEVGLPEEEGYHQRGIRVNYWAEKRASMRAVEMILKKVKGEPFETEYPMPDFGRVEPMPAIEDMSKIKLAIVTSGGIVPTGNPDRIESSSSTKYGVYDISGLDSMPADRFTSVHGGYDRTYALEDINRVVPLDVLRDLEREGVIGELADYFISTTGTGTSVGSSRGFATVFSQKLLADGVGAVILTST